MHIPHVSLPFRKKQVKRTLHKDVAQISTARCIDIFLCETTQKESS